MCRIHVLAIVMVCPCCIWTLGFVECHENGLNQFTIFKSHGLCKDQKRGFKISRVQVNMDLAPTALSPSPSHPVMESYGEKGQNIFSPSFSCCE